MLLNLLITVMLLLGLMLGWIRVQAAARRVAEDHPEAGPLRLVGGGCGGQGHGDGAGHGAGQGAITATRTVRIAPAEQAPPRPTTGSGACAACDNTACKSLTHSATTGNGMP